MHLTGHLPRYLLHGVVAAVGLTTVSTIGLQPRPTASRPIAEAAASSPPMVDLDLGRVPTPAPEATKEPVSDVLEARVAPAQPPKPTSHTVEEGETVRTLAERFRISPLTIMAANGLRNADLLQVGQDLVILPTDGVLYTLRAGESIRRVAQRFGVETGAILDANDLGPDPDLVQPGTRLMVPGATPVLPRRSLAIVQASSGDQQAAAIGGSVALPIEDTAIAVPSTRTYEVQSGDTLAGIAETFGVDVQTILSSNGIDDPDTIKPGVDLRILPVKGLEYAVQPSETLADIAYKYQVDLGLLLDYNDLDDPDVIRVGAKLVVPGGKLRADPVPAPAAIAEAPLPRVSAGAAAAPAVVVAAPAPKPAAPAPKPAAPAPKPAPPAPVMDVGGGGGTIVANAMKYVGYRYAFGGTSPAGFDCSGFVYYIHNRSGAPVGRGMWQQYNGGAHIPMSALQPGDTVFFANTCGGQFIHASDERTGVTVSSLYTSYWQAHYVGATRLWN
ncbi:MAG: LysM peptidoglycan-binding domain-containing protein [Chloroflexi bacterium]|nr:MAG: LysM peptidoglycan-binding domain-containing protein [Chloroflexota bacterium]